MIFGTLHLSSDGPVWVLVGLDRVVGTDPGVQAAWTWRLLALVGALWAVGVWVLGRREGGADAAPDP